MRDEAGRHGMERDEPGWAGTGQRWAAWGSRRLPPCHPAPQTAQALSSPTINLALRIEARPQFGRLSYPASAAGSWRVILTS